MESTLQMVNDIFRPVGTGIFHAGVEVLGQEWSYGHAVSGRTGVYTCPPTCNLQHSHRESIDMGKTALSRKQVWELIERLSAEWLGTEYDLLTHNCVHFSDALLRGLGLASVPEWVSHLAGTGARLRFHIGQVALQAQAAADAAAAKATELDKQFQLSGLVEAFSTRQIEID